MPDSTPIDWQKTFAVQGITLTVPELVAINAAYDNLTQPDITARGSVDNYPYSPFGVLEGLSKVDPQSPGDGVAVALDPNAFQVMRYHDITKKIADSGQWVRFGLQRTMPNGNEFAAFVCPNMFQHSDGASGAVDLARDTPDVAQRLNVLWPQGQRVVALLGSARMRIAEGMELIEPIQQLVAGLPDVAYMTGGYRGESGNCYGVTRAGFDVPKAKGLETLVIMCKAGIADAHQTATAMSIYGKQWGDDTPGLCAACDGAVFFRNIPDTKVYGKWTDVEIANFIHCDKVRVILDPKATATQETHFGIQVPVFQDAAGVVSYLNQNLPSQAKVRARPLLAVKPTTMVPLLQHEKYMAVRLYFDGKEYARWVLQDADGHKPFTDAGLKFSSSKEAIDNERDLVLDGYWKDIMLLQHLGKLPQTGDLAGAYSRYRKTLEQLKSGRSWWWDQTANKSIDGIWFMWPAEHDPKVFAMLQALPLDAYAQKAGG